MTKGKQWSVQEENRLLNLRTEGLTLAQLAVKLGKSRDAVKQKLRRLGLRVVPQRNQGGRPTSSELIMPKELPSVEEILLIQAAAVKALEVPGLSKTEILRLKGLIQATGIYQKRLAEYVDYRGIEKEVVDMKLKYGELVKRHTPEKPVEVKT